MRRFVLQRFVMRAFCFSAAVFLVVSILLSFSCGQKRENDSAELAAISYLIAIGVLRPSVISRPSTEGDPANAQALENCMEDCPDSTLFVP